MLQAWSARRWFHTQIAERTPEIAVWVGHDELAVAGLGGSGILPAAAALHYIDRVPTLLHRHHDLGTRRHRSGMHIINIIDQELKVHTPAKRVLELSGTEPPPWSSGFLKHELGADALEVGEAFSGPLEQHSEAEHVAIEPQRCREIRDVELGNNHEVRTVLVGFAAVR